jgi:CBS domain-containing protein
MKDDQTTPTTISGTGTRPPSAHLHVSDAMHSGVLTCPRDASLARVAELMVAHRVHCVVVTEDGQDGDLLWGLVSDLDLVAAASVRDLEHQSAGAAAATEALTISPAETLQRAAQLMTEHGTAHLVVVDPERRPLGILSTLDVATALGEQGAPT